mmetsp:Transcript_33101/g.87890  ORF Transcript_33101/g.87890 Transcript_33101/m.87890 type:complete len:114 (+) Transcript_33101:593-934(+)
MFNFKIAASVKLILPGLTRAASTLFRARLRPVCPRKCGMCLLQPGRKLIPSDQGGNQVMSEGRYSQVLDIAGLRYMLQQNLLAIWLFRRQIWANLLLLITIFWSTKWRGEIIK